MSATSPLPWRRPRHELLLLILVSAATLSIVYGTTTQDASRMCLTRALAHGHLTIDGCIGASIDRSRYGGHLYSNKAPGMSAMAIPAAEAVRLPTPSRWNNRGDLQLWAVRLLTSGVLFVLMVFLVGRVAEGIAPGYGDATLVTFGLGTLATSFAVSNFDHVPAAALGFAAFVLAWSRRPLLAGLVAGAALTVEYQAAAIVVIVGLFALWQGRHAFARYAAGAIPGVVLSGAYNWAAFGAPWHDPLLYSDNGYRAAHHLGILGIRRPNSFASEKTLFGNKGLLVTSPVLAAAAIGLILLWRRGLRAQAAVCAAVGAAFAIANAGYFDPYGGGSPGVRYFVPALPFLMLGLAMAFQRLPLATWALAVASVVATIPITLTWTEDPGYNNTVWAQLAHLPSSPLHTHLADNVIVWLGAWRGLAAVMVCVLALAAVVVAAAPRRTAT